MNDDRHRELGRGLSKLGVGDAEDASALLVAGGVGGVLGAKIYYAVLYRDSVTLRRLICWYEENGFEHCGSFPMAVRDMLAARDSMILAAKDPFGHEYRIDLRQGKDGIKTLRGGRWARQRGLERIKAHLH